MFVQIGMERRATGQVLDIFTSVQTKFIDQVQRLVFDNIEIAVITVARNDEAVFFVPLDRKTHV